MWFGSFWFPFLTRCHGECGENQCLCIENSHPIPKKSTVGSFVEMEGVAHDKRIISELTASIPWIGLKNPWFCVVGDVIGILTSAIVTVIRPITVHMKRGNNSCKPKSGLPWCPSAMNNKPSKFFSHLVPCSDTSPFLFIYGTVVNLQQSTRIVKSFMSRSAVLLCRQRVHQHWSW